MQIGTFYSEPQMCQTYDTPLLASGLLFIFIYFYIMYVIYYVAIE